MTKFEVRFAIEVRAETPQQAAIIARDMLLDPDTELHADAHAYEYYKPAEDWFPCEDEGVSFCFGDVGAWKQTYGGVLKPYRGPSVRPIESIPWRRVKT
jgi:hypothetical protein